MLQMIYNNEIFGSLVSEEFTDYARLPLQFLLNFSPPPFPGPLHFWSQIKKKHWIF